MLAYAARRRAWLSVNTPCVVLATGGAGQLFDLTTNQPGSRGSGLALALAAGAELMDLEFISFEPLVVTRPGASQGRKSAHHGAQRGRPAGQRPRPRVFSPAARRRARTSSAGRWPARSPRAAVPPAATWCSTSAPSRDRHWTAIQNRRGHPVGRLTHAGSDAGTALHGWRHPDRIDGGGHRARLFAVGEASGGAHGAHRMAAAGGTEVVAMGPVVGAAAAAFAAASPATEHPGPDPEPVLLPTRPSPADQAVLTASESPWVRRAGIIRGADELERSCRALREAATGTEVRSHVGRSARVAAAVAGAALTRTESRGDHFRADFPIGTTSGGAEMCWCGRIRGPANQSTGTRQWGADVSKSGSRPVPGPPRARDQSPASTWQGQHRHRRPPSPAHSTAVRCRTETRTRIMAIAKKLGYSPNAVARGLVTKRTGSDRRRHQ